MKKQFWIPIVAIFVMIAVSASVFADLTAAQVYSQFNAMNSGTGFSFTYAGGTFTSAAGTDSVDIGAYAPTRSGTTSGQTYFMSFCAEPSVGFVAEDGTATLNYNVATGESQNTAGTYLSVGAAYLYMLYATGTLATAPSYITLDNLNTKAALTLDWSGNEFLRKLLDINNNQNFWMEHYDARETYDFMGDYFVFIMDVRTTYLGTITNFNAQDFYYLARSGGGSGGGVPEPATLLLWSLGGFGLVGSWARQRRLKKLALS